MSEIIDKDVKTKERYGKGTKQLPILKRLEKNIRQKLLRVSQKMRSYRFIIMVILGMIYVEDLI